MRQRPADTAPVPTNAADAAATIGRLDRTLLIACGALVRELRAVTTSWPHAPIDLHFLPAPLHNRPDRIVPELEAAIAQRVTPAHDRVFIGYADCGTGGLLDAAIERWREGGRTVQRLPGAHCYEFYAGSTAFRALHDAELGTFFLTDYLARHFDTLIWQGFKLDRHPELIDMLFANYQRIVYLAQTDDPDLREELTARAQAAAALVGLELDVHHTGLGSFREAVVAIAPRSSHPGTSDTEEL